jgi:hypothetical protein
MKKVVLGMLLAAALVGCKSDEKKSQTSQVDTKTTAADSTKYASFGEPMKMSNEAAVPVAAVLANASQYEGKMIRVSGNVSAVCEKKGCWLKMDDASGKELFVKFTCPVNGRLVPLEAKGKPVIAEGTLKIKDVTEAEARHYAEDAGRPQAEIDKIVGPQKQISLMAPSAKVAGL